MKTLLAFLSIALFSSTAVYAATAKFVKSTPTDDSVSDTPLSAILGASYHTEILQKHILGFIVGGEDLTADTTLRGSKITKIEK